MVTKRTRLLSIVTTAIMLVSMLACFVIPASAESDVLAALKLKYDILDPANFEGLEGTPIETARASIATYIEQYNATDDTTMQETLVAMAQEVDAGTTETLTGKVKAGTSFADLPDDWHCPVCGAGKKMFKKLG